MRTANERSVQTEWPQWLTDLTDRKRPDVISEWGTVTMINTETGEKRVGIALGYGNEKAHFVIIDKQHAEEMIDAIRGTIDGWDE